MKRSQKIQTQEGESEERPSQGEGGTLERRCGCFGEEEHIREEAQGIPALIFCPQEADSFPKWWEPA